MEIEKLTKKTIAILRISSILRSADIEIIRRDRIIINEESITLVFGKKKEQRNTREVKMKSIPKFEDLDLCPLITVKEYLNRTKEWITEENKERFILTLNKEHKGMEKE